MKTANTNLLRRASWSLAAAGALGLTGPALAQVDGGPPGGARQQPRSPVPADHSSRGQEHARLYEARVELAWLASPVTFDSPLEARVTGSTLLVRGFIPTDAVRAEAIRIAREESGLNVVDTLSYFARPVIAP